jgi:glycosyltransferase involved in cell wall biosynthesis
MNPEYVIMGGLFWRLTGKKVGLWYVHKQIGVILRIAEKIAHVIFTASRESFRLPSKKLQIVGHGIDMERFKPQTARPIGKDFFRIICIGRISPIKNQDLLIEALNILVNRDGIKNIKAGLIGAPIYPKDKDYQKMLAEKVSRYRLNDYLDFRGSVPNIKIPEIYQTADLSVNLGQTGGMDKTVLESLASGIPAVVLDKTFSDLFGDDAATFILSANSAAELADKIKKISMNKPQIRHLSDKVRDNFSTGGLVGRIIKILTAVNL